MTRQEAVQSLEVSLRNAIEAWTDSECESGAWESLNSYVGEDISRLMAKAAIAVLESGVDVQDYLKADGQLT